MTRALLLVIALAHGACGSGHGDLRWPKSAGTVAAAEDWQEDGGQSLAPRAGTPSVEAAADRRAEPEPSEPRVDPVVAPSAAAAGGGADTPTASERELQEELDAIELPETIIIEIED